MKDFPIKQCWHFHIDIKGTVGRFNCSSWPLRDQFLMQFQCKLFSIKLTVFLLRKYEFLNSTVFRKSCNNYTQPTKNNPQTWTGKINRVIGKIVKAFVLSICVISPRAKLANISAERKFHKMNFSIILTWWKPFQWFACFCPFLQQILNQVLSSPVPDCVHKLQPVIQDSETFYWLD